MVKDQYALYYRKSSCKGIDMVYFCYMSFETTQINLYVHLSFSKYLIVVLNQKQWYGCKYLVIDPFIFVPYYIELTILTTRIEHASQ